MDVAPAPILSALVGIANAALFVLIFGSARARLVLLFPAAILGAFAGQAIGAHLADPFRIGDFALLWASGFAWLGIVIVVLVSQLGPARTGRRR